MRKSQAANYARWSAVAALLCAAITAGAYLKRQYTRHVERKNAPPAAPVNVERQSTSLTFSKGEGTRTIFTMEASKSTDFKGLNASDLEGVKVTIYGKDGDRHDTLDTHTCRYSKDSGNFDCQGDVEIVLMSKATWDSAGGKPDARGMPTGAMKVESKGMLFNRASGEARTDSEVRFTFANGSGQAVGATYNSDQGTLQLLHDVKLKLDQPQPSAQSKSAPPRSLTAGKEPVDVTGSRLDFQRDAGTMFLSGPAEAKTHSERLTASAFLLELDDNFRAKRLTAKRIGQSPLPEFTAANGTGRQRISAEEIAANFSPQGLVTHAEASRQVSGEALKDAQTQTVKARNASMEMVAGQNAPKLLILEGAVDARTSAQAPGSSAPDTRKLTTDELRIVFAAKTKSPGTRLQNASTPGPGRLEWNDAGRDPATSATAPSSAATGSATRGPTGQTILLANQLNMDFDSGGAASRLDAKGNVQTERLVGGNRQTATANTGYVHLEQAGGWSRIELDDNVQLNELQRTARADQAIFVRAEQTATLTGHALAKDATSQSTAEKLIFWQDSGEVRGEGNVRSSDLSARNTTVHLAPVACNVTADHLTGNSKTGRALYSGHARLWQGDSVLEAESIELLKSERVLNASGNVRAVFPQAPASSDGNPTQAPPATSPSKPPVLWHAQSGKLTYWDAENRAHLWQNVIVHAPDQKMTGPDLQLFFTRAANGQPATGLGAPGAQQISRAVGTGGVTVMQGDRRATADRGVYTASDGRFVMTGGTPTLFDASEGTTTGRQLTFFLADATIIVDSENGSRTLTKHRVEK